MGFNSCIKKMDELYPIINKFNLSCPTQTYIGDIDSIRLVEDTVYINISVNSSFPFDVYVKNADKAKNISLIELCLYTKYENTSDVFIKLVNANKYVVINYQAKLDNREATCILRGSEVKEKYKSIGTYSLAQLAIISQVTTNNLKCPAKIDDGITINGVHYDGKDIIYEYGIDEDVLYFENVRANLNEYKSYMLSTLIPTKYESQYATFLSYLEECNCGYVYNFTGNKSGNSASFRIDLTDF